MKTKIFIFSFLFIFSCSPEKGIPVEYSQTCNLENNDKVLEVSGYLKDEGSVYCSNTSGRYECGFNLIGEDKNAKGFTVNIQVGSSSNSVEKLESGYSQKDIKIHDDRGDIVNLEQKVTITGKITTVKDPDEVCYLKVNRIELK